MENTIKAEDPGSSLEPAVQDGQINLVDSSDVSSQPVADNIVLQDALKTTRLGELTVSGALPPDPEPTLMPEISGEIPVYSDGRLNFRKDPFSRRWQVDWNYQGQRVWAPVAALGNGVWQLLRTHTRDRQHFPRELDQLVWTLLNMPEPRQRQTNPGGRMTLPAGFEGSVTYSSGSRAHLQPKRKPFVNPAKARQKADRLARKAARKAQAR